MATPPLRSAAVSSPVVPAYRAPAPASNSITLVPKPIPLAPLTVTRETPSRSVPTLKLAPRFSVARPVSSKDQIQAAAKQRLGKLVHHISVFESKPPVGIKPFFTARMIPLHKIQEAFHSRAFFKGGVILVDSFHSKALMISTPLASFVAGLKKLFSTNPSGSVSTTPIFQLRKALHTSLNAAPLPGDLRARGLRSVVIQIQNLAVSLLRRLERVLMWFFPQFRPAFGERSRTGGQGGRDRGSVMRERMSRAFWAKHLHRINKKRVRKANKKNTQHIFKLPNDTWEPLD